MRITCTAAPLHARYAAPRVLSIVCGTAKKHHRPRCPHARESSASKASQRDDCGSLLAEGSGGPWGRVCGPCLPTGQASTNGSPSRNHPLSHAAIATRSTPRLAFYGVGFFRRSSLWHVLGQVARDGGLGHHRVKRVESPGGQDEDSLCTPREAAGGFTSEGPFCEGRPERNAPEGNQVVSRFRGVWIVATREPLDLAVAVCAAIASRVASDSSFCRTRPGHGCRRQAHHGHHQIVFLCAGFPVARREHPGTMRCWWWVCGRSFFFVVPTPRRNSRVLAPACGPRIVSHWPPALIPICHRPRKMEG